MSTWSFDLDIIFLLQYTPQQGLIIFKSINQSGARSESVHQAAQNKEEAEEKETSRGRVRQHADSATTWLIYFTLSNALISGSIWIYTLFLIKTITKDRLALIWCAVAVKHRAPITPTTGLLEDRVEHFKNMTDKDPRTYANRRSVPWNEVTREISKFQQRPQVEIVHCTVGNDMEGRQILLWCETTLYLASNTF